MKETIYKAFAEVDDIIEHSGFGIQDCIPVKFKNMIKQYKDNEYSVNIDYSKNINEQDLLQETREILALLYRDYICSNEEREKLIEKNNKEIKEIENNYDIKKIFEKKIESDVNDKIKQENYPTITSKKRWYQKLFDKIFAIFSKKNN